MKRVFLSIVLMVSIFAYCNAKNDYPCPSELRHLDKCAISAIYQDRSGVVWINSDFGMHRYDSYVLRTIDAHSSGHPSCFNGENLLYYTKEGGAVCLNTDSECVTSIRIPALSNPKKYILYASGSDLIAGLGQDIMTAINDSLVTVVRIPDNLGKIKAMTTSPNEGRFLAGSGNGYLLEFDLYGNLSIISSFNDEICSLFTDSDRYTYIGFENAGYVRLDSGFNTETQHRDNKSSIPRQVRAFTQTSDGRILLGTLDGLYSIDHSGCLENTSMHMPSGHAVSSLFADNRDNIWIGTFYSGLILLPKEGYPYTNIDFPKEYNVQLIDGITEDNNGNLWIATDRYGLYCYSPSKEAFRKITELGNGKFKCINYDSKRNVLWLGEYKGQLYRYDINTGNVHKFHAVDRRGNEITISVYDIISKEDELYLGTSRGIYILNPKTEKVISRIIPGLNSFVYSMTKDTEDRLWIASRGIYYIENGMIEKSPLPDTEAYSQVYCDNEGYIWATCSGKGAYKFTEESIEMFSKDNCGLETNAVYRVCQLGKDRYLFGTESGISIYDKSINICHNYGSDNGLNLGSMKDGHSIMTCNGIAFIGGTEGLVRISSDVIIDNTCDGSPHIDRVTINGKEYTLSWFDSVKKKLNHTENNISFYLTDDDYTKTSSYYSRYFLEGYSQEWIDAEIGENISFSSLRPGKYRLLLRSSAFKYADEYKESDITFNISPPWYYSATAVIIYILLIVILSILILLIVNRNMLKEERIKAKEKENEDRMKFFINISHELRTPLTLIIGQLELLETGQGLDDKARQNVFSTIEKAKQINELVSDLLDFEKMNQSYTTLHVCETNLTCLIQNIVDSFSYYADYKNISLSFKRPEEDIYAFLDNAKIQKVISNLLINSFRFTPELGCIAIDLSLSKTGTAVITVEDTGCGISEDALNRIFYPFYQDPLSENSRRSQGTGIGLALSKGIVEMHKGTICAGNSRTGGAVFKIELNLGKKWIGEDERIYLTDRVSIPPLNISLPQETENKTDSFNDGNKATRILLIEDDEDMRAMLKKIFEYSYEVLEASNGSEGLMITKEEHPDIIICDVMMPVMDGLSFCSQVKNNFATCHIPVVLLTAYDSRQNNMESIRAGADEYISKPFSIDILKSRCRNLLENRKRLQQKFSVNSAGIEHLTKDSRDKEFLMNVTLCVEENISDYNLNVNTLCEYTSMSRTILTEKIKGLTGYTPREFIEVIRFKKAALLLKETDMTISEISYEVGFNSQKYFSSRFKKQFGKTPSEWAER